MCAKFRFSISSRCDDIVAEVKGGNCMPPAAGGWRGGPAAPGLTFAIENNSAESFYTFFSFFFLSYEIFRHSLTGDQECRHPQSSDSQNRTFTKEKSKLQTRGTPYYEMEDNIKSPRRISQEKDTVSLKKKIIRGQRRQRWSQQLAVSTFLSMQTHSFN